jgi:hypothetical protein
MVGVAEIIHASATAVMGRIVVIAGASRRTARIDRAMPGLTEGGVVAVNSTA